MGIEGRLTIDLERANDGTGRAAIASSRPLGVARVFVGRSADEAVRTLPVLFNVCGLAQGAAAAQACESALVIEVDAETRCVRSLLVAVETLREHLVRAVMDWPRFLGSEPQTDDMLRAMRLCMRLRRLLDPDSTALAIGGRARFDSTRFAAEMRELVRLVEELVVGEPLEVWRSRRHAVTLAAWAGAGRTPSQRLVRHVLERDWAGAGRAVTSFLPDLADDELAERLLGEDNEVFVAAPTWNGAPHETSALSRQAKSPLVRALERSHGSGLLTRIAARLVEIGELPRIMSRLVEDLPAASASGPNGGSTQQRTARSGRGLAQVEAARGRLVHGVEIEDDRVRRYAILAPTEWNFHGNGAAVRGLADIAGRMGEVRQVAELFVTAVDPCVGYELKVR
jgi:uptake hydrogenase large subunit